MTTTAATTAAGTTAAAPGRGALQPLFALTDEELAVLAGEDQGLVAMPHLAALEGEARTVAVHTAYRSLLASGLVSLPDRPTGPSPSAAAERADPVERTGAGARFAVELPAEVDAVLVLRRGAPVLLCLQRDVAGAAGETVLRYVHLVEDVALVEDVLAAGLHRFGRVPREELGECVQQFLVPDDAVPGEGPAFAVDPSDVAGAGDGCGTGGTEGSGLHVAGVLGRCTVNADATVRHDGDDGPGELLGMFLGPEGSWVTGNRFGAGGPLTLDPLDPATVGDRVLALVAAAERCVTMGR